MKRSLLFLISVSVFASLTAQYSVSGGSGAPLMAVNNTSNRLQVYMLNGLSGAQISFTSSNSGAQQWYRYRQSANTATPVPSVQSGNMSYITGADIIKDGYGYFVGSPTDPLTQYIWIIDYSNYATKDSTSLQALDDANRCTSLTVEANTGAAPLSYNLPIGASVNLNRIYYLQYNTLLWDEDNKQFLPQQIDSLVMGNAQGFSDFEISPPPLVNTSFTLTGDTFAMHFGLQKAITSAEYQAVAVEAHTTAVTTKEFASNEIHNPGDTFGGSAPVKYIFTAYANEPTASSYNWKISQKDSITNSLTEVAHSTYKVWQYEFDKNGTYVVALEVRGTQLVCIDTTQNFTVVIDNTVVKIPNAFSPGSSIGANDILKVAFTSVITFKASVFNRWGNLLFQWTDASKGWDGRVNGKFAPTGVYYVIVEYKDSNGKSRTMSRAVNLLRANDSNINTNQ